MNPTAIYSKSGKGVQEASGKTSLLKRPDRAVLSAIDGRATLGEVAQKVGRPFDASFQALVQQLDKDGFVREVTAGAPSAPPSRPAAAPPSRPAPPPKPAAKPAASADPASDLDFSSLGTPKAAPSSRPAAPSSRPAAPSSRPAAPPPPPPSPQQVQQTKAQQSALDKAREEAEAKGAAERERVRKEAEEKARAELEVKMRAEAEQKLKEEAEARVKADAEAKVKAKLDAERRAREEAERAHREAEEKARREAEELRQRLEAERRAREEAERKAREEAERLRREAEEQARKLREEAERKAREEADRVRRELEAERQRLEEERRKEEAEREARRRQREEEERREEAERVARRRQREEEDRRHEEERQRLAEERRRQEADIPAAAREPEAPKAAAPGGSFADSLMSDLESFTNKDEEEQKARAEAERQAKAEAERRRREEAEREAQEQAEARRREEEEAQRREEEKRRAREEEERLAREEERRKREAEEIRRKAEAATAAAMAKQAASAEEDIPISEDDLDLDEVKKERKALGIDEKKEKERAQEEEREARKRKRTEEKRRREAEKKAAKAPVAPSGMRRRPTSWGRPVALFLTVVLVVALVVAHVVPMDVAPYEQAATEGLGQPVKIGSARLWLFTGVQIRMDNVRVGDVRVKRVIAHPALGSIFGERKQFGLLEFEGLSLPQAAFGEALFSRVKSDRFAVEQIRVRDLDLPGGLVLPKPLEVEAALDGKGAVRSATVHGPDGLNMQITPKDDVLQFEATAAGLPLPIAPDVTLSQFAMKGTATRSGMDLAEWGGAIFNGGVSGTAKVRWGSAWNVEGVLTVRSINAAVFAPALLSEGNADGTGRFSMSGSDPAKLFAASRAEGRFTISKGTLGSFDLSRAIQSRGKQVTGTTQFAELAGQVTVDHGAVALRNVTIGAGALNAGANAEITKGGALSGRIVADVRTAAQTLSATLNLGGTVKEPQVRD